MTWRPKPTRRAVLSGLALVAASVATGVAGVFAVGFAKAPPATDLATRVRRFESAHLIRPVPLSRVSLAFREAVVATEDERFYQHSGVDLIALLRALPFDASHLSLAQGASTIAEQLAKIIYLGGNDHSAWRKAEDVVLGYRLGHRYSHEVVLAAYLNSVYLGEGQYGVERASRHYFRRPPSRLNLSQASLLAGLIQAPSLYDPAADPTRARLRQADVLRSMVRNGYATEEEASAVVGSRLPLATGASLPALHRVSFAVGSPFDWGELASALVMLVLAVCAFAFARAADPPLAPAAALRVAGALLLLVSLGTAAHSVQVV